MDPTTLNTLVTIVGLALLVEVAILFYLSLRSLLIGWGAKADPSIAKEEKVHEGWSAWRFMWLTETAGSHRRDRFTRNAQGKIRHYVAYSAHRVIDLPGDGTDVTEMDERRGLDLEQMAQNLGCDIFDE